LPPESRAARPEDTFGESRRGLATEGEDSSKKGSVEEERRELKCEFEGGCRVGYVGAEKGEEEGEEGEREHVSGECEVQAD